jgi:hypothetical protein
MTLWAKPHGDKMEKICVKLSPRVLRKASPSHYVLKIGHKYQSAGCFLCYAASVGLCQDGGVEMRSSEVI